MTRFARVFAIGLVALSLAGARASWAAERSFPAGSLIIPMDLAYQDQGMFQAYGLVFPLLRQGVQVYWVIDPNKTWHAAACNTAGDPCAWDCAEEGSGTKCAYPTASPDFFAAPRCCGRRAAGARRHHRHEPRLPRRPVRHRRRRRGHALAIIDAWNDQSQWAANPWAQRTVFQVVSVHEATAAFTGDVRKEMVAAPTIAVFSDGNEDIATGYLRAAGIPQSNGGEFPAGKCGAANCGPGTANPDMLTVQAIMGDMGTCDSAQHRPQERRLFTRRRARLLPDHDHALGRERPRAVECEGGCPATQAECTGEAITYHGHEVVAEVRPFLQYPVHFFAECQAVNAYENTVPNPAWPFLDDAGRDGHFLTTTGNPPSCTNPGCACTDADYKCVEGWCDAARDCCQPKDVKERGAGYLIAAQPQSDTMKVLRPDVPYNQLDGAFGTMGGSEPAYNLSTYLGTGYKNDREVTFITGPNGPGEQDLWMTGYLDGTCDIGDPDTPGSGTCGSARSATSAATSTTPPCP